MFRKESNIELKEKLFLQSFLPTKSGNLDRNILKLYSLDMKKPLYATKHIRAILLIYAVYIENFIFSVDKFYSTASTFSSYSSVGMLSSFWKSKQMPNL